MLVPLLFRGVSPGGHIANGELRRVKARDQGTTEGARAIKRSWILKHLGWTSR